MNENKIGCLEYLDQYLQKIFELGVYIYIYIIVYQINKTLNYINNILKMY